MHATPLRQYGLGQAQPAATCPDAGSDIHGPENSALLATRQAIFYSARGAIDDALDLAPSCAGMAAAKHTHGRDIQLSRRTAGFETQAAFAIAVGRHTVSVAKWESGTAYPDAKARVPGGRFWPRQPDEMCELGRKSGVPGGIRTRVSALKGPRRRQNQA